MEKRRSTASVQHSEEDLADGARNAHVESMSLIQIEKLAHLLDRSDIAEVELNRMNDGLHLVLRKLKHSRSSEQMNGSQHVSTGKADISPAKPTPSGIISHLHCLKAHLVGTFHPWLKPGGKTLVDIGDFVKPGQMVGTIEALTILHEVEATVAGRVVEIFVQDGQSIEFGQPLLTIDSSGNETL